jgi:hypothetical protein
MLTYADVCVVEIPADGHCLFSTINDQLKRSPDACVGDDTSTYTTDTHTYKSLRRGAAKYMLEVTYADLC